MNREGEILIKTFIKRTIPIVVTLALGVCALCVNVLAVDGWTERQDMAHEIAEMAREMGLSEDNPIIVESSRIWWEEENAKNREPELIYVGRYKVTGYDSCAMCNGNSSGLSAMGTELTVGRTVAAGGQFAFGTRIYIDGIGYRMVEDRGCASNVIDVLCNNHSECYAITGYYDVYVVE